MFGYRHAYHAGNSADVFKHLVLCALLQAQTAKPAALAYIETHAGAGCYDLAGAQAARNGEFVSGAAALWARAGDDAAALPGAPATPPAAAALLAQLRACNGERLRRYPGSPAIAAAMLRAVDRLRLCELLDEEFTELRARFRGDRRVQLRQEDGYGALRALLPPRESRGLVLIDPAYESPAEARRVSAALGDALTRFGHGVFAVWLPLRGKLDAAGMLRQCVGPAVRSALLLELRVSDALPGALPSAMLVLNPPYQFQCAIEAELAWLAAALPPALQPRWGQRWLRS